MPRLPKKVFPLSGPARHSAPAFDFDPPHHFQFPIQFPPAFRRVRATILGEERLEEKPEGNSDRLSQMLGMPSGRKVVQRFSDACAPVGAPAPSQAKPRGCLPLIDRDRRRESAREGAGAPI
jgi:hypothetical protein